MLDITNPQSMIEVGYYDDYPSISFNPSSSYFFRSWYYVPGSNPPVKETYDWAAGIYGVFPDPNRSNICYAGGVGGFYIFDVTPPPFAPTNLSIEAVQGNYVLSWTPSQSPNLSSYIIYRADVPNGEPYLLTEYDIINAYSGGNPVSSYEDIGSYPGQGSGMYFYQVSALNAAGYESVQSNRVSAPKGDIDKKSGEEEGDNMEIIEYSLSDNYPNPFNPSTIISYSLKEDALVSLKVFDILGNVVVELVDNFQTKGKHDINFNAAELSSGVYIYRLTAMNGERIEFSDTKQMTLVK